MKKSSPVGVSLLGKVRKRNEDSFIFTNDTRHKNQISIIADGIGSCKYGDLASRFVCELFFREWEKSGAADFKSVAAMEDFMVSTLEFVNSELHKLNQTNAEYQLCHIGTTIVAMVVMDKYVVVIHAGDSRFYEFTGKGELILHTEDHTLLNRAKKIGAFDVPGFTEEEYEHVLTKAVGVREKITGELLQTIRRNSKSRYLLCSDGLSHQISDEAISKILRESGTNEDALNKLILATYFAGASDNLTIILR